MTLHPNTSTKSTTVTTTTSTTKTSATFSNKRCCQPAHSLVLARIQVRIHFVTVRLVRSSHDRTVRYSLYLDTISVLTYAYKGKRHSTEEVELTRDGFASSHGGWGTLMYVTYSRERFAVTDPYQIGVSSLSSGEVV